MKSQKQNRIELRWRYKELINVGGSKFSFVNSAVGIARVIVWLISGF